jgi:hypothetical protein
MSQGSSSGHGSPNEVVVVVLTLESDPVFQRTYKMPQV